MSLHTILFVALLSAGVAGFTVFYFATSLVHNVLNEADFWGERRSNTGNLATNDERLGKPKLDLA
jgi:hypothetical protein